MANGRPDAILTAEWRFDEAKMDRQARMAAQKMERAFALGQYTTNFNQFEKSIQAATSRVLAFGLTVGIFVGIKRGLEEAVKAAINVEKSLTDINIILNLSTKNLRLFSEDLFKVAKDTGQTFTIAAKAATEFSRQGLGVEQTLKRTRDALILSRLAGIDTMTAVADLTAAINSFSNSILDSTQLVSKFVAVDQRFAVSSADLAEAIKRVGSTAQDAGIGIDDLIGLVTTLQERTARGGAVIGNALKTIFTRVQDPDILDQLETFDITVRDMQNNALPALKVLDNIADAFDRMGRSGDRDILAKKIGGVYQINQLRSLLRDLERKGESTTSKASEISRGAGADALIRNEQLNQTLFGQINKLTQNLQLAFSRFGQGALEGPFKYWIEEFNGYLEMVTKSGKPEEAGEIVARGMLRGISDFIMGPGLIALGGLGLTLGKLIFKDLGQALRSFTVVQASLREQGAELIKQSVLLQQIANIGNERLAKERAVLGVIEAQNIAFRRGNNRLPGTSNNLNLASPYSITGQMGAQTRRINKIDAIMPANTDPEMALLLKGQRQIAESEIAALRKQLPEARTRHNLTVMTQAAFNALKQRDLYTGTELINRPGIEDLTESSKRVFGKGSGNARSILDTVDPILLNKIQQERIGRIQNRAFVGSMIAPLLGGTLGEAAFGGEGRENRIGRTVVSGIGSSVGAGLMGGFMTGSVSIGILMGVITGVTNLLNILKEMKNILPEVNARLSVVKDALARADERIQAAYQLNEMAQKLRTGEVPGTESNKTNFRNLTSKFGAGMQAEGTSGINQSNMINTILNKGPEDIKVLETIVQNLENMKSGKSAEPVRTLDK